jgi:hypothetical protein
MGRIDRRRKVIGQKKPVKSHNYYANKGYNFLAPGQKVRIGDKNVGRITLTGKGELKFRGHKADTWGKKLKRMLGKGTRATVGRVSHAKGTLQHEMRLELMEKGETQKTRESLGRASNVISRFDQSGKRGHLKIRRLEGGGVMYKEIGANKLAELKEHLGLFESRTGKAKIKIFDSVTGNRIRYKDQKINTAIDGYLRNQAKVRNPSGKKEKRVKGNISDRVYMIE